MTTATVLTALKYLAIAIMAGWLLFAGTVFLAAALLPWGS